MIADIRAVTIAYLCLNASILSISDMFDVNMIRLFKCLRKYNYILNT